MDIKSAMGAYSRGEKMNLISCDGCGAVFDRHKMCFPKNIYKADGSVDEDKSAWDGYNYVPIIMCPVCDLEPILSLLEEELI